MKTTFSTKNVFTLALALVVSALFLAATRAGGQTPKQTDALPSAGNPTTQPTPTSTPTPASTPASTPGDIIDDIDTVSVESNLVVVPVSVTNAAGQPVQGLTVKDFQLWEEGRAQEITQIGNPEQVPLEIAILLDISSSVTERFAFEQQAATRFLKQVLKSSDKAAVFTINQKSQLEQELASADVASTKLLSLKPANGPVPTAFYDTVIAASKYLAQKTPERHRRVIVVISDGEDNFSDSIRDAEIAVRKADAAEDTPQTRRERIESRRMELHRKAQADVLREVQRADVVFYSINPSGESLRLNKISQRAQDGMQKLADETGGTAFAPNKIEDLELIFQRIAAELRAQYLLQYYSADESPTGKYLRLKVAVPTQPQQRVRARQGYYAKRK
jgi:Ca-activated chloride channel family protein